MATTRKTMMRNDRDPSAIMTACSLAMGRPWEKDFPLECPREVGFVPPVSFS
jgi:hypothetical protein